MRRYPFLLRSHSLRPRQLQDNIVEISETVASSQKMDAKLRTALLVTPLAGVLTYIAAPPFFPQMADDLGTSVPLLGQATTLILLLSGIAGLIAGPIADRRGFRGVVSICGLAGVAGLALSGLAPSMLILFLAAPLAGISNGVLPSLSFAVASTTVIPRDRPTALSIVTSSMAGAGIIAVPVLAVIGDLIDWRAALLSAAALALVASGLVWIAFPTTGGGHAAPKSLRDAYTPLIQDPVTLRILAATFVRSAGWIGMLTYYGSFLSDQLGLTTSQIGLAYMGGGTGYLVGSLLSGRILSRFPASSVTIIMTVAMGIMMIVVFSQVFGTVGSLIGVPLAALTGAIGWVGQVSLISTETRGMPGATMSFNGATMNVGAAAGGAIGGALLATGGYAALSIGLPTLILASALLIGTASRQSRLSRSAPGLDTSTSESLVDRR